MWHLKKLAYPFLEDPACSSEDSSSGETGSLYFQILLIEQSWLSFIRWINFWILCLQRTLTATPPSDSDIDAESYYDSESICESESPVGSFSFETERQQVPDECDEATTTDEPEF